MNALWKKISKCVNLDQNLTQRTLKIIFKVRNFFKVRCHTAVLRQPYETERFFRNLVHMTAVRQPQYLCETGLTNTPFLRQTRKQVDVLWFIARIDRILYVNKMWSCFKICIGVTCANNYIYIPVLFYSCQLLINADVISLI